MGRFSRDGPEGRKAPSVGDTLREAERERERIAWD
jgi:hypothetical protein